MKLAANTTNILCGATKQVCPLSDSSESKSGRDVGMGLTKRLYIMHSSFLSYIFMPHISFLFRGCYLLSSKLSSLVQIIFFFFVLFTAGYDSV